jgi:hypothetical protein
MGNPTKQMQQGGAHHGLRRVSVYHYARKKPLTSESIGFNQDLDWSIKLTAPRKHLPSRGATSGAVIR